MGYRGAVAKSCGQRGNDAQNRILVADSVRARAADEGVGTAEPFEIVVAGAAVQRIDRSIPDQRIVMGAANQILDILERVAQSVIGLGERAQQKGRIERYNNALRRWAVTDRVCAPAAVE